MCQENPANSNTDMLRVRDERYSFTTSAHTWLVHHAVRCLNSTNQEDEAVYKYVLELLSRNESSTEIIQLVRSVPEADSMLRWNLLYLLGDIGDKKAAKWLAEFIVRPLPERGEGCEGPRDIELLLRTMAIESLQKIAKRHSEVSDLFLDITSQNPDRGILIEAVKAAMELGLRDKLVQQLSKDHHWMLELRKARVEEMHAVSERTDSKERDFIPPKSFSEFSSPTINCECRKGGSYHG
jgi:hypothetical protein